MNVEVRPCASTEELRRRAQRDQPVLRPRERSVEDAERFLNWIELDRMHGAWDGDRIVGGAGAFSFDVSVPGGEPRPGRRRDRGRRAADATAAAACSRR